MKLIILIVFILFINLNYCLKIKEQAQVVVDGSGSKQSVNSFYIENGNFFMNDQGGNGGGLSQYQIISGSFHYFRCLPELWMDRLMKIKACGLNTIQTYIPWNVHQPNGFNTELVATNDLIQFLKQAQQVGLNVILRPGPYACAEWELGGFPYWILEQQPIALRSSDSVFISAVIAYWSRLLPLLEPYLFTNGGPVIMVQVENEYGSYGEDKSYLETLLTLLQKYLGQGDGNGSGVLFHSTDGPSAQMLFGSKLEGVYQTVDFGPMPMEQIQDNFKIQQTFASKPTPLMNSEYYTGWITHWGDSSAARTDASVVAQGLDDILSLNASVNMYMFFGGSNPGFMNGANSNSPTTDFEITIQSYDYDSPLTESGDTTEKYFAIKNVIEKYINNNNKQTSNSNTLPPVPSNSTKVAYGTIQITQATSLFNNLGNLVNQKQQQLQTGGPIPMEQLQQSTGFVLYETTMNIAQSNQLSITELHDRATFFINDEAIEDTVTTGQAVFLQRPFNSSIEINYPSNVTEDGDFNLRILLENQGRVNFGPYLNDRKGLLSGGVMSGQQYIGPWNNYPLPLTNKTLSNINNWQPIKDYTLSNTPTFYQATLSINSTTDIGDTFLSFTGLGKGQLFVNGYNVGRYWNVGPQRTIYISSVLLHQGDNEIILFETLLTQSIIEIQFLNQPYFD
ncbi:hypothetical protein ACTFIV_008280 [Dictyostelium citrinum]